MKSTLLFLKQNWDVFLVLTYVIVTIVTSYLLWADGCQATMPNINHSVVILTHVLISFMAGAAGTMVRPSIVKKNYIGATVLAISCILFPILLYILDTAC